MISNPHNNPTSKASIVSFVPKTSASVSAIACYHSTNSTSFSLICKARKIVDVKNRDSSVFLFYGKPSYTLKSGGSIMNEVSIVFDPSAISNLKTVYPFDSGGLSSGRYASYFESCYPRNDITYIADFFQMTPSIAFIRQFITFFYESNDSYMLNSFSSFGEDENFDELIHLWQRMVSSVSYTHDLDPPASTIEIQVNSPISVDASSLFRIFMPVGYLDKADILEFLVEAGISLRHIETYEDELLADKTSLWSALVDLSKSANTAISDRKATRTVAE
jgi:hypothetical protein